MQKHKRYVNTHTHTHTHTHNSILIVGPKKTASPAFALPTVLIASIVMLMVLMAAVTSVSATRSALQAGYYNTLAGSASEAGIAYAKTCLTNNNGVPQWTNAKPLMPNTDCTGTQLTGFSCPNNSIDTRCSVMVGNGVLTTFSIALPQLTSSGMASNVTSTGTAELLRTSNNAQWRQYAKSSHLIINDPAVGFASTIRVLVVAGGGGGATDIDVGGGGGGGGVLTGSLSLSAQSYPVTVGAGGARGTGPDNTGVGGGTNGTQGGNSVFSSMTAIGGGYGGTRSQPGGSGGSGGGGGDSSQPGGLGTSGQGYNGGAGPGMNSQSGNDSGGGGGAGGAASYNIPGVGLFSSLGNATFARGGRGGQLISPADGAANTGNGGDGARAGGSGIVIISYPTGSITATGGTITTSGGNTMHTFTSSGTFTVLRVNLVVQVLEI